MLQIQHLRRTESHFHKYVAQNPSASILYTNACAKLPTNSPHANIWTYIFDFEHYIRIMCPLYSPSTSDTCLSSSGLSTNISAIRKYSEVQGHANPSETYMTSVCADFGTILMCVLIHIYMISLMKKGFWFSTNRFILRTIDSGNSRTYMLPANVEMVA